MCLPEEAAPQPNTTRNGVTSPKRRAGLRSPAVGRREDLFTGALIRGDTRHRTELARPTAI